MAFFRGRTGGKDHDHTYTRAHALAFLSTDQNNLRGHRRYGGFGDYGDALL